MTGNEQVIAATPKDRTDNALPRRAPGFGEEVGPKSAGSLSMVSVGRRRLWVQDQRFAAPNRLDGA
jgi:hypothetical protein